MGEGLIVRRGGGMPTDEDLIPRNIRKDIDIFGVVGTLVEGKSGIDFGTITPSSYTTSISFSHNLGITPTKVVVVLSSLLGSTGLSGSDVRCLVDTSGLGTSSIEPGYYSVIGATINKTTTSVTITTKSSVMFGKALYYWFVIA